MLELQKSQLFELVSQRLSSFEQSLSSNDSVVEWDDAETALRAALYHLRHLSQSWSQVLSREVYHLALGNLVDTIFTLLLDPIFAAKDITDAASRFLHSLFLDAARGCAEVFLVGESSTTHPAISPAETNQQIKVAVKYSMLFEKLQCIGQFMTMRLDDITRGLEEGVFRSVTGKELTHLVTATYDESAKRNDLLKVLASR
jgi:centromere/kinetochore protein ZW10